MATRSNGWSTGFGWLARGFSVGFRHPKPLWGGAAVLLVAAFLPTLLTLPARIHALQGGVPVAPVTSIGWTLLSMLIGLLVTPLYGGFLQMVDASESGRPARMRDIFRPYGDGSALRLIGFGLVVMLAYVTLFAIILVALGGGLLHWYMQLLGMHAQPQPLPATLPLPHGFGMFFALTMVVALFFTAFYAIGLGQITLGRRGVFASVGDGIVGAVKNVLPLLAFVLGGLLAAIAAAIAMIFVALVAVLLGKLLGGWLALVILVPLYIAFMMTLFLGMFGVSYHIWRDVCGTDDHVATAETIPA